MMNNGLLGSALTHFSLEFRKVTRRYIVPFALILLSISASAEDWTQFRGPNSSGIGTGSPPIEFGPKQNILWATSVGPGHSSPCIHGDHIFLTTFNGDASTVNVECFHRDTGQKFWATPFLVGTFENGHPSFNPASSSPCCDDECIVAYFGSYGLVCLDHSGVVKWEQRMPTAKSFGGNATSPIIHKNKVVLYRGTYNDHYIACFDKHSGKELWRVPQTEKFTGEMACTACPIVHGEKLICHSARSVQAFDINTGERLWIAQCATTATSTPIVVGSEVLIGTWNKLGEPDLRPPFPDFDQLLSDHDKNENRSISRQEFPKLWIFHRPEGVEAPMNGAPVSFKHADKNRDGQITGNEWSRTTAELEKFRDGYETHGLLAISLDSTGHISADDVRVLTTRGIPEVPSPVSDGRYVYLIKNGGQLSVASIKDQEFEYRIRTKGTGTHYASPLIADGRIYTFSGNGTASVCGLGDGKPQILAVNNIGDDIFATPAIVDGVIYLRTHSMLFAFEESVE